MLGDAQVQDTAPRLLAVVLTVVAVWLGARLQRITVALREQEETSRWASNLRDLVNLGALAAFLGAFMVAGLPTWGAVLAAGTVVIVLESARHLPQTHAGRYRLAILLGLGLALPVALFPVRAMAGLDAVAVSLFGG